MKTLRFLKAAVAVAALCSFAGLAQAQEKKVKDQMEYDLFNAAMKETDPAKKVAALNTWKEKYPDSDFKADRLVVMIQTYQQLQQADRMYATAKELKGIDPNNITALFYLTSLPPSMNVTTPERLTEAEQNAEALKAAIPAAFANPPAGADANALAQQRRAFERQVIKTNVWVATQRKDMAKVEQIYSDALKANAQDGESSYELGKAILATKDPKRQAEALYHIGRAAYYEGPNALDANTRKQVQQFFEKTVTNFTGEKSETQRIADITKTSTFPPDGFEIKSSAQRLAEQEEALKASDPQKYLWLQVKKALVAEDGSGAAYFENIKGAGLPKLKGTLLSATPENRPKELTIAIMNADTPDIKLVVDKPFGGMPPAGTVLEFETAVPTEFAPDPFLVTATIDQEQITGWPAELVGPPAKKGAAKKAAPKKK